MRIIDVKTTYVPFPFREGFRPAWVPGTTFRRLGVTVVQILTDEGLTGIAGTRSHGGEQAEADDSRFNDLLQVLTVEQKVKPYLLGKDPFHIQKHIETVRDASLFGSIPWFVMVALWDIIGKACNKPISKLWGASKERVKAYASTGELRSPEQRAEDAIRFKEEGFKALKLRFHHDDPKDDLEVLEAVRNAVGDDFSIMVDANQGNVFPSAWSGTIWNYQIALQVAKELKRSGAEWLEEPLHEYNFRDLSRLAEDSEVPIAGGERRQGVHALKRDLDEHIYDIIQPDPCYSEGIFQIVKIAALAEAHFVKCVPHCWSNGLGLAANLHLAAAIPGCDWVEYPYDPPGFTEEIFQGIIDRPILVEDDGYITVPEKPGLGVELNADEVRKRGISIEDIA